jgi:phosphopantetheine--protein transferase-like protein
MKKAKKIIAHFLKISPESIQDETKMDYTVIASSVIQHRMYSLLADNGYIVDDPGSIVNFKDFRIMVSASNQSITPPASKEESLSADLNSTNLTQSHQNIGIDIEEISNFPESKNFNLDRFYIDNFTLNEIEYCKSKVNPRNSFAAIFSLKESIIKADSALIELPFNQIEISHDNEGRPIYSGFLLSNSHSSGNVVSVAIKNNIIENTENFNLTNNLFSNDVFSKKQVIIIGFFSVTISVMLSFLIG